MIQLKICGLKVPDNIREVAELQPDYIGMIFYPKSPRYIEPSRTPMPLTPGIKRVGVFVNENPVQISRLARQHRLDLLQLHGDENPGYCAAVGQLGMPLIKAFGINPGFDFDSLAAYQPHCQHFLFDTRSSKYGGTGESFDWAELKNYTLDTPFFLSGGISPDDAEKIKQFAHPSLHAIDINSKFETAPGVKDIGALTTFIHELGR
jgi:phosphoribosylanthranilate isomerase